MTEISPGQSLYFYILKDKGDLHELREGDVIGFNVEFDANDKATFVGRVTHVR
ncbi:MAG: hypothetical protein ACKV19_25500 [Verrucomicrobiales bacterium]